MVIDTYIKHFRCIFISHECLTCTTRQVIHNQNKYKCIKEYAIADTYLHITTLYYLNISSNTYVHTYKCAGGRIIIHLMLLIKRSLKSVTICQKDSLSFFCLRSMEQNAYFWYIYYYTIQYFIYITFHHNYLQICCRAI